MLVDIIFIILPVISLAGIAYLVYRNLDKIKSLPRYPEMSLPSHSSFFRRLARKMKEIRYTKYQASIFSRLEKIIRQLKIIVLKIDGFFSDWLGKMKERSHVFNIRSKAWMVKKHIEDEKERIQIEEITNGNRNGNGNGKKERDDQDIEDEEEKEDGEEVSFEEKKYIDIIAADPKNIKAYKGLSSLYVKRGNLKDAKAALRQVLKIDPDDSDARKRLEKIIS